MERKRGRERERQGRFQPVVSESGVRWKCPKMDLVGFVTWG